MRIRRFAASVAGLALMLLSGHKPFAQAQANGSTGPDGGTDVAASPRSPLPPYTVIRKTSRVKTLADGTTSFHERLVKEARDSQGRSYREMRLPSPADPENSMLDQIVVRVTDPVAGTMTSWNTETHEAAVYHFQKRGPATLPQLAAGPGGNGRVFVTQLATFRKDGTIVPIPVKEKREDLGTKTIDGLKCVGVRITRDVPAGAEMNDKPITITSEQWFSPELGIAVLWISDDPRLGVSTIELLGLDRGNPDAALFRLPDGYAVKEKYPDKQR
jgi:hypothetical protein